MCRLPTPRAFLSPSCHFGANEERVTARAAGSINLGQRAALARGLTLHSAPYTPRCWLTVKLCSSPSKTIRILYTAAPPSGLSGCATTITPPCHSPGITV